MLHRRAAWVLLSCSSIIAGLWACETDPSGGGGGFSFDGGPSPSFDGSGSTFDAGPGSCGAGTVRCGDECVDLASSAAHCGACNRACPATEECRGGACTAGAASCIIDGGLAEAGALDPADECRACVPGSATTTWTPRTNGSACGAAQFCTSGVCGPSWHGSSPGLLALYGGMSAAGPDGRLYFFGGYSQAGPFSTATQIYDPATGAVTTGANVPYTTYRGGAVTAPNGLIYVFGGSTGTNVTYAYDPVANTFTPKKNMPVSIAEFGFTLGKDGKIYVFAITGSTPPWTVAHTLVYDPAADEWTSAAPMPTPRQLAFAVTLNDGRIMVVGGNTGSVNVNYSTVNEIYTPSTNTWTTAAPIPQNFDYTQGGLRSDGRVIAGSGLSYPSGAQTPAMFVYDPVANSWAEGTPTTVVHRLGYSARTPNGRLYVYGGRAAGGQNTAVIDALY